MERFIPDMYQKSIYHIDYDKLKEDGIKCLLIDLDNTCVPYRVKEPNKKLIDLFETLKDMDFKVIIFSNASKKRIYPFKNALNVDCSARSMKPRTRKVFKILKMFKYDLSDVAIIGDQLCTDILCGNKAGIKTILINPMSKDDMILTKVLRFIENKKFKQMAKMDILKKGKYYE